MTCIQVIVMGSAYSAVPHCLSIVACPGSAVESKTACKKRKMGVNLSLAPTSTRRGPDGELQLAMTDVVCGFRERIVLP